jgi:hypothetical protein
MTDAFDGLVGALAGAPSMPDALCRGRTEWDHTEGDNAEYAIGMCIHRCFEYDKCRRWSSTLNDNQIGGIVAGEIRVWSPLKNRRRATA